MVDREHVLVVLRGRFRGASVQQFAEAANAIVALPDEWEEVRIESIRSPTGHAPHDVEFRIFRRRRGEADSWDRGRRLRGIPRTG